MLGLSVMFVVVAIVVAAPLENMKHDNDKIYKVFPRTKDQVKLPQLLEKDENNEFELVDSMKNTSIAHRTMISNVPILVTRKYLNLEEINLYLIELSEKYPDEVEVVVGGRTYQGRRIMGVKLFGGRSRPKVFFEGGIHAREWIAPATVLYIIDQLLNSRDKLVKDLASRYEFHVFPVVNADGYAYTHEEDGDRNWRKTMSGPKSDDFNDCFGTDLNRNFNWKWGETGSSTNPCDEDYGGEKAFSEVESETFAQYITSVQEDLIAYIAFHSYRQLIMFPYGHSLQHIGNYDDLKKIADKAAEALKKRHSETYKTGSIAETIYPSSGGSTDWVKDTLKVPLVFLYELRDLGLYGFFLPPTAIVPTGEEVLDSLVALLAEGRRLGYSA